jgi:hypothetical protein
MGPQYKHALQNLREIFGGGRRARDSVLRIGAAAANLSLFRGRVNFFPKKNTPVPKSHLKVAICNA